ncbi:MAG: UbiA prenyltransferase family protein [Candidatus Margulisiibacteriota bacterium]
MIESVITLLRPYQYIKNFFIFLPFFFGLKGFNVNLIYQLVFTFIAFSSVASAIYIFNDIIDIKHDRAHPIKKHRPLASGQLSIKVATILGIGLICFGLFIACIQNVWFSFLLYICLNILYSLKLKHIPIIDVFIIAIGFVIRLVIGSSVSNVELSMWIVIMTFLLALFLAFSKRKGDLVNLNGQSQARPVLDEYTQEFLSICMAIMGSVVIVAYIMYTTSATVIAYTNSNYVYATSIFVVFGILRYLKITFYDQTTGNPTKVLIYDIWLQLSILFWLLSFAILLYR